MTKENRLRSRFEYLASTFGVTIFAFYWSVITSFPEFYFVNPNNEEPARAVAIVFLIIGWFSISTLAPIVLFQFGAGKYRTIAALPYVVAVWPVSILVAQIERMVTTGQNYLSYLIDTPLFLATDLIIPLALISLWLRLRLHHLD
ncbi:MAG: hypothetical protein RLZ30_932 [Actinomycetota bacterium]|jgi:hypothetical protein